MNEILKKELRDDILHDLNFNALVSVDSVEVGERPAVRAKVAETLKERIADSIMETVLRIIEPAAQ